MKKLLCIVAVILFLITTTWDLRTAYAQPVDFDIAAKPLAGALAEFAAATNLQVLYSGELTKGLNTAGVSGRHEPEEALNMLLKDSGLTYRFTDVNTVTLDRADSSMLAPAAAVAATGAVVVAAADDEDRKSVV